MLLLLLLLQHTRPDSTKFPLEQALSEKESSESPTTRPDSTKSPFKDVPEGDATKFFSEEASFIAAPKKSDAASKDTTTLKSNEDAHPKANTVGTETLSDDTDKIEIEKNSKRSGCLASIAAGSSKSSYISLDDFVRDGSKSTGDPVLKHGRSVKYKGKPTSVSKASSEVTASDEKSGKRSKSRQKKDFPPKKAKKTADRTNRCVRMKLERSEHANP